MKIALAQIDTTVGDLRGNSGKLLEFYRRGVVAGTDVVMTPELAITGYPPRDLLAKHRFVDDNLRALDELAAQIGPTALLVGYVDFNPKRPGRDYVNAVALIQNGKILARRHKMLLPTYDVFDEDRYFQPAESNTVLDFAGQRLGLTIWMGSRFDRCLLEVGDDIQTILRLGHPTVHFLAGDRPFRTAQARIRAKGEVRNSRMRICSRLPEAIIDAMANRRRKGEEADGVLPAKPRIRPDLNLSRR